ncbi:MAG: hypothetical protein WBC55_03935 [Dehalococcoidia bacterium]
MRTREGSIGVDSVVILIALVMAVSGFAYFALRGLVSLAAGK